MNPCCAPQSRVAFSINGFEDGLEVECRAADDLQHLGGRGLLLQRLGHLAIAGLQLLEQPHVLDGDDGLVGEGLEQLDLPVGERTDLAPRDDDRADGLPSRSIGTAGCSASRRRPA